jgi:hypothetical protein
LGVGLGVDLGAGWGVGLYGLQTQQTLRPSFPG